ncbi:hypothetical protein C8Q79DRAFT_975544 [Trametes meyenii]|nr:hypothetical protein C8Q79DRAFT_975544 [Trametes meyenii]
MYSPSLAILERCEVPELRKLRRLRARGWKEELLDDHFDSQKRRADMPPMKAQYVWYYGMANVMRELDSVATFIPPCGGFEFLDIGCAPGGFSQHVLQRNPSARGLGVSLSESRGGHAFLLEPTYLDRYEYVQQDLLEYDLSSAEDTGVPERGPLGVPLPTSFHYRFSLVMLDGHALRTYHVPDPIVSNVPQPQNVRGAYASILLIAQLIIALTSVHPGGTIVVTLSHIEAFPAAHIVFLLDAISDTVVVHKPRTMHAIRGSFYAIGKGVGSSGERAAMKGRYLEGLKTLWSELQYGGTEGGARALRENDLDFVVTAEEILDFEGEHLGRLIELGRDVWKTQADALEHFFHRKGIRTYQF